MGLAGFSAAETFERINSYSQRTNREVVVISQETIDCAPQLTRQHSHQSSPKALNKLFAGPQPTQPGALDTGSADSGEGPVHLVILTGHSHDEGSLMDERAFVISERLR